MKRKSKVETQSPSATSSSGLQNPRQLALYFEYILALLRPGKTVRTFQTVPPQVKKVGELVEWEATELQLLIDESRRHLDSQATRFDRIRQTAQVVTPLGVALLVVLGAELNRITIIDANWLRAGLLTSWVISITLVLVGTLGSAASLVVKASFGSVLPSMLSQGEPKDIQRELASALAEQSSVGENTLNTRLTLQWWSVCFLAFGGLMFAALWITRTLL